VFPGVLETGCVFVGLEVRVDELDESVEVFGRDLHTVRRVEVTIRVKLTASFSWSK
jgi:hypothetical protein